MRLFLDRNNNQWEPHLPAITMVYNTKKVARQATDVHYDITPVSPATSPPTGFRLTFKKMLMETRTPRPCRSAKTTPSQSPCYRPKCCQEQYPPATIQQRRPVPATGGEPLGPPTRGQLSDEMWSPDTEMEAASAMDQNEPTTTHDEPMTTRDEPMMTRDEPVTSLRRPVTSLRRPVTSQQRWTPTRRTRQTRCAPCR